MTTDERFQKLYDLGCIVCLLGFKVVNHPEIHHLDGQSKPGCHDLTISLCTNHHRRKSNFGYWVSRHGDGRKAFEKEYGSEMELLELTNTMIGVGNE